MAAPNTFLNWTDGSAPNVLQPPSSLQVSGWMAGQAPPFEYMNWLFWLTDQWIQYFAGLNAGSNPIFNCRLLTSGNFNYVNSSGVLTWSSAIDISVPNIPDSYNSLAAGNCTLTDGDVGYITLNIPVIAIGNTTTSSDQLTNLTITQGISVGMQIFGPGITPGTTVSSISGNTVTMSAGAATGMSGATFAFAFNTALSVTVVANSAFNPNTTEFLLFRRFGGIVYIGFNENGMQILDGQTKPFLGNYFYPPDIAPLSGSGNYTVPTPSGRVVKYLIVEVSAGGGGGGGGINAGAGGTGTPGGNTTFGTSLVTANGGAGGLGTQGGAAGVLGGTVVVNSPAVIIQAFQGGSSQGGGRQSSGANSSPAGGNGGSNPLGGWGGGGGENAAAGGDAIDGSGGGGGGGAGSQTDSASGGAAGGYAKVMIPFPSGTYAFSIGSGGAGGIASSGAEDGGVGGDGCIVVWACYQ